MGSQFAALHLGLWVRGLGAVLVPGLAGGSDVQPCGLSGPCPSGPGKVEGTPQRPVADRAASSGSTALPCHLGAHCSQDSGLPLSGAEVTSLSSSPWDLGTHMN